tara:strand:+ start:11316 stop:12044 length:729 start_codon:yes stop_codon:yes gene_type:complete
MESIIVFGSNGKIGSRICEQGKQERYKVIGLSRGANSKCDVYFDVDFLDYNSLVNVVEKIAFEDIKAIFFCQRSRLHSNQSRNNLIKGLETELNPIFVIKDKLKSLKIKQYINIVTMTSNTTKHWNHDTDYNYHVIKSSVLEASLGLSFCNKNCNINSNILRFGEILDERKKEHSPIKIKIFDKIKEIINSNDIVSIDKICNMAMILARADEFLMNGEIITLDKGLSKVSQESIIRSFYKDT